MISRVLAADVPRHVSERVRIAGWTVTANSQAPGGAELTRPVITPLSEAATAPPFDLYRPTVTAGLPTILDHAPTTLRHPALRSGFEIAAASVAGFRDTLGGLGFTEVYTPKIVESATESGANVFGIDYFGRPAYLAQSPQFYKQALVGVFERVFEVGPAFRAEPHDTARHLAEYTSLDAELGFIADHHDVMAALRDTIACMAARVADRAGRAVAILGLVLPAVPERIPEIHFAEAQEPIAQQADRDPRGEPDLAPEDERWLGDWAVREFGSEFLFVTGYPMAKRPFYTHPDPAKRLHRHGDYLAALAARGEDPRPYAGYLQVFEHGMPPHGGFAIGLERWTARLAGVANVRQVTLFPRDIHRLRP